MKTKLFLVLLFINTVCFSQTKVEGGIQFNDIDTFEGNELMLNGAGNRDKYYAIGLYLDFEVDGAQDGIMVAEKDATMALTVKITSGSLSTEDLKELFRNGLERATDGNSYLFEDQIRDFLNLIPKEINRYDIFRIVYLKGKGLAITKNKKSLGSVGDLEFKKAFFKIWLGSNPINAELKEDLLAAMPVNPVLGKWKAVDKETGVATSTVQLYMIKKKVFGAIEEMLRQSEKDNICYDCTGDDKNQKVEGLVILKNLQAKGDGKFVDGKYTNIKDGSVSDCQIWIEEDNPNILNVKYKGSGGTHQWLRIKEEKTDYKTVKF
ncbi:hypothetical protein GCM10022393_28610 [Aquimarina addita]|uniref:DUF2147 domain-containing protein n=1 Tax=Aquimarina addita TaxID=870485 RepID=A0ABP6UQI0_9FLAO